MQRIKQLLRLSKKHYPTCKHLQREWVLKTEWLERTGKHARFTGGWGVEGAQARVTI